jgi:peptidoglycan/LPS O-acetylase OafA/YrhL
LLVFGLLALSGSILASFSRPLAGLTMVAAAAYFPLLAVLASLWRDRRLAWGSLLLAAICCQACLILAGTRGVDQPLYWTGAALLAGCLGTMARRAGPFMAALWTRPLYVSAAVTWGIALFASTGGLLNNHHALQTPAITLAMGGAACLLAGIRGRRSLYLGVGTALLACAYMLEMFFLNVTQPQAFSLPVGIAVYLLAYLEWRQSTSPGRKNLLEVVAGIGLLGAALLQAIGQLDATGNHLAYAVLLLLEGTTVLAFGAALRWTRTFFAGGAAIVAGMLIVVAEPLRNLSVVYLALLIGCAMIALVVFLEQRRRRIPLWIDEVRVGLETWS